MKSAIPWLTSLMNKKGEIPNVVANSETRTPFSTASVPLPPTAVTTCSSSSLRL